MLNYYSATCRIRPTTWEDTMALISLRQLLDHAAEHNYGVPAFNVNNLEQMRAIMLAADATNSPVIVQASAGARKYAGAPFLRHLILAAVEEFPHIPVVMHQDHGTSPDVCQRSIQLGFSSVMMDGSLKSDGKTPADYAYNVDVTRTVVNFAHACGVSVEGEIGCLGSLETGMAGEEDGVGAEGVLDHSQLLTEPEEAARFVQDTGVDALAIAIGTSHGAYKFTRPPTGDILAIDRIKDIHQRIPNTDLRLASTGAIRRHMAQNPSEFDPRKFFKDTIVAMRDVCVDRYEAFNCAGQASKIRALSLDAMTERYIRGELR